MQPSSYTEQRGRIETYFDRTAVQAWARLTSDAPVGRIRASVRAGRDRMRATLLSWLPNDLNGVRILDAGCGTGALAVEAARRGADVVAIDLSPTLVQLARDRLPQDLGKGSVDFRSGDMLDPALGHFDHVVSMDSVIHYQAGDAVRVLDALAQRTARSIVFTFAPGTVPLVMMRAVGRLFPKSDRAPAIVPIAPKLMATLLAESEHFADWRVDRQLRVSGGFYTSQAMEIVRR